MLTHVSGILANVLGCFQRCPRISPYLAIFLQLSILPMITIRTSFGFSALWDGLRILSRRCRNAGYARTGTINGFTHAT